MVKRYIVCITAHHMSLHKMLFVLYWIALTDSDSKQIAL